MGTPLSTWSSDAPPTEAPALEAEVPVTVEFEDVDSFRIAHHTRLVAFLERARLRLLCGLGASLTDVVPVLYAMDLRFRRPALLMDRLLVVSRVDSFDPWHLRLESRIHRSGATLVKARATVAFADLATGQLAPVPTVVMDVLTAARQAGRLPPGEP